MVCSAQKTTFAETARMITTPQVSKVRRMEVVKEKGCLLQKSRNMLKQILEEVEQNIKLKCFHMTALCSKEIGKRHDENQDPSHQQKG